MVDILENIRGQPLERQVHPKPVVQGQAHEGRVCPNCGPPQTGKNIRELTPKSGQLATNNAISADRFRIFLASAGSPTGANYFLHADIFHALKDDLPIEPGNRGSFGKQ